MKKRIDRTGEFRTDFEKNRRVVFATQTVCGICGLPVDFTYRPPHPMSACVDHIIPVSKGGHPSDLQNLQLAHRWCNRQKSDKLTVEGFRRDLVREGEKVDNDDLPLHFAWADYRASEEGKTEQGGIPHR